MRLLLSAVLVMVGCGDAGGSTTSNATTSGSTTSGDAPTTSGDTTSTPGGTGTTGSEGTSGIASEGTSGSSTGEDPFGGDSVCSRGLSWDMGNKESPFMNPGMACTTCHTQLAPFVASRILVGGTVYETGHEPDLCFGIDGVKEPMFVEITDADAVVTQLEVNEGGNFLWDRVVHGTIAFPITVRVVRGDQERVMMAPQMDGNCNSCHTEDGANGAPGRIVAP